MTQDLHHLAGQRASHGWVPCIPVLWVAIQPAPFLGIIHPKERGRHAGTEEIMAKQIRLSKAARDLLRRRANSERVDVTPANLETYRKLARAGIMEPFSGFMRGPEAFFRFTQRRWERREELQRYRFAPSAMLRRIFRAFSATGSSVSDAR